MSSNPIEFRRRRPKVTRFQYGPPPMYETLPPTFEDMMEVGDLVVGMGEDIPYRCTCRVLRLDEDGAHLECDLACPLYEHQRAAAEGGGR